MNTNIIVIALVFGWLFFYIIAKLLLQKLALEEIIVHVYLISFLIVFTIFHKNFINSFKKIDLNYTLLLLLFAITLLISSYFGIMGCNTKINFGKIDGLAVALYLPLVCIISAYFFKDAITWQNCVGIVFVIFGAYLININ